MSLKMNPSPQPPSDTPEPEAPQSAPAGQAVRTDGPDSLSPPDRWELPVASPVDAQISHTYDRQPQLPPPVVSQPEEPVQLPLEPPRRSLKKPLLGLLAAALIMLISGAAVFAFIYNRPAQAVDDALYKLLSAPAVPSDGSLVVKQGDAFSIEATYVQSVDADGENAVNIDSNIKIDQTSYNLKTALITDTEASYHVRLDGVGKLLEDIGRGDSGAAWTASMLTDFAKMIDSKWIVIKQSDFSSGGDEAEEGKPSPMQCSEDVLSNLRGDSRQLQELTARYQDNRFIIVVKTVGVETIGGAPHNRYVLRVDEATLRSFAESLKDTEVFKKLDACWGGELARSYDPESIAKGFVADEGEELTYELWVDMFSHEPGRMKVVSMTKDGGVELTINPHFDKRTSVEVPQPDKTVPELQTELQNLLTVQLNDRSTRLGRTGALARDAERKNDIVAVAAGLEAYYTEKGYYPTPAQLDQPNVFTTLKSVNLDALQAPSQSNYSLVFAKNLGVQAPTKDQYVYQPLNAEGVLCSTDKKCTRYILWYFYESDQTIQKHQSLH